MCVWKMLSDRFQPTAAPRNGKAFRCHQRGAIATAKALVFADGDGKLPIIARRVFRLPQNTARGLSASFQFDRRYASAA